MKRKDRVLHPDRNPKWNSFLAVLFLLLLSIIFFYPVLLCNRTFYAFDNLFRDLPWSPSAADAFTGNPLITDPVHQLYPFYHFIIHSFKKGFLSFWNPNYFCGFTLPPGGLSLLGNPIVILSYLLFPLCSAHDVVLWVHLFGSGIFMFLYLRAIELDRLPSLLGAVSWMFNGYVMVWFEFEIFVIIALSLPASFYFTEIWFRWRKAPALLGLVFSAGIATGSGNAHLLMYQVLFSGAFLVYCIVSHRKKVRRRLRGKDFFHLSGAWVLLLLIAGNCITANVSSLEQSQRKSYGFHELFSHTGELPPKYLSTLLFPDFFGNPADGFAITPRMHSAQDYNNYNELCLYVGILPLLLSVFSIRYFFSDAAIAFYSTSAAVFLTMAMGSVLYYPLASYIPGLDTTTPTRILYLFGFCMSVMAAVGADRLLLAQGRDRFAAVTVAALVLAAALALSAFVQTHSGKMWAGGMEGLMGIPSVSERIDNHFSLLSKSMLKPLLLVLASAVLISSAALTSKVSRKKVLLFIAVCLTSYDLLSFGLHYNTTTPKSMAYPETGGIRYLKNDPTLFRTIHFGNFSPNFLSTFGIEDVGGYQSIYPKRYAEFIHLSQYGPDMPLPDHFSRWMQFVRFGLPVLHILNTKYILLPTSARLEASTYPLVYDGEIKIYRNRKAFPRAFFVPEQQFCSSREEAFQLLSTYSISDFRKRVILEAPETEKPDSSQPVGREGHATISWLRNQPGLLDIAVAAETDGYLVIGDGFHPGWKATVDGVKTAVWRANYIMRAVRIPAGNHRVLLRFRPAMLTAGAAATLLGWTFWLFVTAAALLRRKSGKSLR